MGEEAKAPSGWPVNCTVRNCNLDALPVLAIVILILKSTE